MSLAEIMKMAGRHEEAVLGTVVDVEGSAYRQPGARVLVLGTGERFGMISGGCLDKDLARHAFAWTQGGPTTVLYDTRGDELRPQGAFGSGCDGIVQLFLERLAGSGRALLNAIEGAWACDRGLKVATVYDAAGEYVDLVGTRVVSEPSGMPAHLEAALREVMETASTWCRPRSVKLVDGRGSVRALVESIEPAPRLLVLGAGDDARPLVAMAQNLGWNVEVADKWPALATSSRFAGARVVCKPVESVLEHVTLGPRTWVVMMTHNFDDDVFLLPALLRTDVPWVGLMGPRRRTARLMRALLEGGELPVAEALSRVQTPVGLDLGADRPEEVALSVLGGLVAARNGASAGLLREREQSSIHPAHERIELRLDARTREVS